MAVSREGIERARRITMAQRDALGLDKPKMEKPAHSFANFEQMQKRRINKSPDSLANCRISINEIN